MVTLFDRARFYFDFADDPRTADSLSQMALDVAQGTYRVDWQILAANLYAESNNLFDFQDKALIYLSGAEKLAASYGYNREMFRIYRNMVRIYQCGYQYEKALDYAYRLLSLAVTESDEGQKCEGFMAIGKCLEGKNLRMEAFRNYLNAESLASALNDTGLLIKTFDCLSEFFRTNRLFKKARDYKLRQLQVVSGGDPVDSLALNWVRYDLQEIAVNENSFVYSESAFRDIVGFAKRLSHHRLANYEMALTRTWLTESGQITRLRDIYSGFLADEFKRMERTDPGMFFRLKAYFSEEEGRIDSALYYFGKAEAFFSHETNRVLRSKFYYRFGEFLLRQGRLEEAASRFRMSLELAGSARYLDYVLKTSRALENLFAEKGDFRNAYAFAVQNKLLEDSLLRISEKDRLLVMEIDHETQMRERAARQEEERHARRRTLEYTAMVIALGVLFVVLLMLGSLKVPEWIIRSLGFFVFVFLFEFIVLVADHEIHLWTHGTPWKVLLIKIVLIGFLMPFHHWVEKRVVGFLLNPSLVNIARFPLRQKVKGVMTRRKSQTGESV